MIEWIVLIWFTASPGNQFVRSVYGEQVWHVSVSSSQEAFENDWNKLNGDERKNSRIFKGSEVMVKNPLILISNPPYPRHWCSNHNIDMVRIDKDTWQCPISKVIWNKGANGVTDDKEFIVQ